MQQTIQRNLYPSRPLMRFSAENKPRVGTSAWAANQIHQLVQQSQSQGQGTSVSPQAAREIFSKLRNDTERLNFLLRLWMNYLAPKQPIINNASKALLALHEALEVDLFRERFPESGKGGCYLPQYGPV